MQARGEGPAGLPAPDPEALAHSARLVNLVRERIDAAGGAISFAEYMNLVLYAPGLGYYSAGSRKFGAGGDFVTAPEVSPLFARVVARQLAEVLATAGGDTLLELGAGSGRYAVDLLESLARIDALPEQYLILEVSGELRDRQRQRIVECIPGLLERIRWLEALPAEPIRGVIFGNEVADALPVERFRREPDGCSQAVVIADADRLTLGWRAASGPVADAVAAIEHRLGGRLPAGYVSELSLGLPGWIGDLAGVLREGLLLLSDYGLAEREYYSHERNTGTFRCHYRHRAHDDPLLWPGLQDLTAWVDFSALSRAATGAGLELAGYTTQAKFLIEGGLEAELAGYAELPEKQRLALSGEVKTLTLPGEMGEAFRFIGFRRGGIPRPAGFAPRDLRHTL